MTIDLSAMRSNLIGHLRREKHQLRKENISAVVSLMKTRDQTDDTVRIDQFLGWQMERLAANDNTEQRRAA